MNFRVISLVMSALLIGFLVGNKSAPPKVIEKTVAIEAPPDDDLRSKFQKLTDEEITDYYRLKTMEEKYLKADEILGKIMTIFLADLGLRISKETLNASKQPPIKPESQKRVIPEVPKRLETPVDPRKKWADLPKNETEIKEFLEDQKMKSVEPLSEGSKDFTENPELVEDLNGLFVGSTKVVIDKRMRTWNVSIRTRMRIRDGQPRGRWEVEIFQEGKRITQNTNEGNIQAFREFAADDSAIMIQASPSLVFQMYYIKSLDVLTGNIYRRGDTDKNFLPIGAVQLQRRLR